MDRPLRKLRPYKTWRVRVALVWDSYALEQGFVIYRRDTGLRRSRARDYCLF